MRGFDQGTKLDRAMGVVIVWKENRIWIKTKDGIENGSDINALILKSGFWCYPAQEDPKPVCLFIEWTADGG